MNVHEGKKSISRLKSKLNKKISVIHEKSEQKPTPSVNVKLNSRKELFMMFLTELLVSITSSNVDENLTDAHEHHLPSTVLSDADENSRKSTSRLSKSWEIQSSEKPYTINHEAELTAEVKNYIEKRNSEPTLATAKQARVECKNTKALQKILFTSGHHYEGETENCLMHGLGTFTWNDGTVYKGEFKNGYPTGSGKMVLPDLSTYTGNFLMGHFHGEGVMNICYTTIIYKGNWKNGKKHGKGWISYGPDNWYEGDWLEDKKHGFGHRQYKKGLKYKGEWDSDQKHGQGRMLWDNNDYYEGQWQNNQQHGYGEYTWDATYNEHFIFLIYNWYKGAWINGKRTGIGLMHFGSETGSKLAGMWENNLKEGPGILSSGNGKIIACNPLFENDKPVHKTRLGNTPKVDLSKEASSLSARQTGLTNLYRQIVGMINKKEPIYQLTQDVCEEITTYSENLKQYFHKIDDDPEKYSTWQPLKISIHVTVESINFTYYVNEILAFYNKSTLKRPPSNVIGQMSSAPEYFAIRIQEDKHISEEKLHKTQHGNEERLLKNYILLNLQRLRNLYAVYTKFTYPETKTKPILVRLFLWQLLRDIQIYRTVSLVEADLYFSSNPWSCTETDHNPFEEIYFWQFVQYLVGCSWLFHQKNKTMKELPNSGIVTYIFRRFLEHMVFPYFGKFDGKALGEYRDLLPIKGVYQLYCSVGEPHTIRAFLNNTCPKSEADPPCYFGRHTDNKEIVVTHGYNVVPVGNVVSFIKTKSATTPNAETSDMFHNTLFTFRNLGRKKLIQCTSAVLPNIRRASQSVYMNYKINFLEFLEIILVCAYEKADNIKNDEIMKHFAGKSAVTVGPRTSSMRTTRKNGYKKKHPYHNII